MCRRVNFFPLLAALLVGLMGACGHAPEKPVNLRLSQAIELEQKGQQAYRQGHAAAAAGHFEAALRVDMSIENHDGIVADRLNLAQALDASGDVGGARRQLDALLSDSPLSLSPEQIARAKAALGLMALKQGELADAQRLIDEAQQACAKTCPSAAAILNINARIALERNNPSAALASAGAALPLLAEGSHLGERANSLRIIGLARLALGEAVAALAPLLQALALDRELGLPERIADDLLQLGRTHAATGNQGNAEYFYRRALTVAEASGNAALAQRVREANKP